MLTFSYESVCGDEVFTRNVSIDFFNTGIEQIREDIVHPPLYYAVVHFSLKLFGDNPFGLRFPSIFFSIFSIIILMLWIASKHQNLFPTILSGILLSFSYPVLLLSFMFKDFLKGYIC
jgi:uncharacterized membrane protein